MKTLVLKCVESVNNPNLRTMNEIRLRFLKNGDGSGMTQFGRVRDWNSPATENLEFEIVGGSGTLYDNNGTSLGQSCSMLCKTAATTPKIKVTGDYCDVSIKNFAKVANSLGTQNENFNDAGENKPTLTFEENLLYENVQLEIVRVIATGLQPKNISKMPYLTVFSGWLGNGNLSEIVRGATSLSTISSTQSSNQPFEWSIEDIANMSADDINVNLRFYKHTGGDFYTTLKGLNGKSVTIDGKYCYGTVWTCSYQNGNAIPTITINSIDMRSSTANKLYAAKNDILSFLNLLNNGVGNGITVTGEIKLSCNTATMQDADVQSLITALAGKGVTVTFHT